MAITSNFAHGFLSDATAEDMQEYSENCLENYRAMSWMADSSLEYISDDFKNYTVNGFKGLEKNTRQSLRDHLRENCVTSRRDSVLKFLLPYILNASSTRPGPMTISIGRPPSRPTRRAGSRRQASSHKLELSLMRCVKHKNQWLLLPRV